MSLRNKIDYFLHSSQGTYFKAAQDRSIRNENLR